MDRTVRPYAAERGRALEAQRPRWSPQTSAELLDEVATRHPGRPLLLGDVAPVTYARMSSWSRELSGGLTAMGVRRGDHVAVDLPNLPETVALRFALARVGAVTVSVNTQLRHDELRYVLAQSDARLLVTADRFRDLDYLDSLDRIAPGWDRRPPGRAGEGSLPELRDVVVLGTAGPVSRGVPFARLLGHPVETTGRVDPHGVSDILYTSGTTGAAKGVQLSHDGLLRTAYSSALVRAFGDGWRLAFALPLHHVFGYVEGLLAALFVGGAVRLHATFDADRLLADVERHRIDELICVPSMTSEVLARARERRYDLTSLHTLFSSGGPHRPGMWTEMREVLGVDEIFTAYGQTETTASTVCTRPGDPTERLVSTNGAPKPAGAAGDAALGGLLAEYAALDPATGTRVPPGQVGELVVRGPSVTRGYYNKPQETLEAFTADGWLRTGDLGLLDEQGYLVLTGRSKDTYRCGGELVMPAETEQVLLSHPAVADAYVVGLPDERMGEVGCAWVVPHDGVPAPSAEELTRHCAARLARFKVPAAVLFCETDELPRTSTGKVRKHLLVQRAQGLLQASGTATGDRPCPQDEPAGPPPGCQLNRSRSARLSTLP
ncbi:class I adenylate-forming enzyme family protein [Pseudonocardia pini]|uniref:class I adenylate-forming enzyme family protein n=1 Tax=Pseudonocardia pini TaxID=2758030 RepID=UPI0015F0C4E6|nr:AMP-binding protein [Pseudonocardia pini]